MYMYVQFIFEHTALLSINVYIIRLHIHAC